MKSYHRILRHEEPWISCLQRKLELLLEQKARVGDAIAHLDEIFECQYGDGIGVYFARVFEVAEKIRPYGAVPVKQFEEKGAIFKRAIHALAEKGNDRVSRVAQQHRFAAVMPGRTANGHHGAGRVAEIVFVQMRHQRDS